MSLPREATATCPACDAEFEVEVFASVNVSLDPDLKRRVLDGSLFDHTCPKCGKLSCLGHDLLYHDMERRFQVELRPQGNSPSAAERNLAEAMFGSGPVGEGYRLRWVEAGHELAEKVRVFDAGLDDRIVELVKVWSIAGTEELEKPLVFSRLERSRGGIEFLTDRGEVVAVSFDRYARLREHYAAKLEPDQGCLRIDRGFALRILGLGSRAAGANRPAAVDKIAYADVVKAEASGKAIVGVDRVYARRLFTGTPASAIADAAGERVGVEKLVVLGFYFASPLALLASIVAGAFAFGWISAAVSLVLLVVWFVNRGLSCAGNSSAWPATLLVTGAAVAHVMHASANPWVTGFALLSAFALWCDRMLYASATVALRALVRSNPRALAAFADGVSVRWLGDPSAASSMASPSGDDKSPTVSGSDLSVPGSSAFRASFLRGAEAHAAGSSRDPPSDERCPRGWLVGWDRKHKSTYDDRVF